MEHLSEQVNHLIKTTIAMEDLRQTKDEQEIDPWMQLSQPFPEEEEDCYFWNSEDKMTREDIKEIGTQTEKSPDLFPTEKSITKRKKSQVYSNEDKIFSH